MMHDPNNCTVCEEEQQHEITQRELEAIRAFVERVLRLYKAQETLDCEHVLWLELKAMEKEDVSCTT